jgi:hypothetical protein
MQQLSRTVKNSTTSKKSPFLRVNRGRKYPLSGKVRSLTIATIMTAGPASNLALICVIYWADIMLGS